MKHIDLNQAVDLANDLNPVLMSDPVFQACILPTGEVRRKGIPSDPRAYRQERLTRISESCGPDVNSELVDKLVGDLLEPYLLVEDHYNEGSGVYLRYWVDFFIDPVRQNPLTNESFYLIGGQCNDILVHPDTVIFWA